MGENQDAIRNSDDEKVELEHQCEEIEVLQRKESGLDTNVVTRSCS